RGRMPKRILSLRVAPREYPDGAILLNRPRQLNDFTIKLHRQSIAGKPLTDAAGNLRTCYARRKFLGVSIWKRNFNTHDYRRIRGTKMPKEAESTKQKA